VLTVYENPGQPGPGTRFSPALAEVSSQCELRAGVSAKPPVFLLSGAPGRPFALQNLPPFPAIALRVAQLISNEDVWVKELSDLIRADQSLSAELLRMANSPLFGFRREITSVVQAVALLGQERIRGLALTAGMQSYLARPLKIPALHLCWQHSLASAIAAEKLARVAYMEEDSAYTAGLLHDIGRLALMVADPARYAQLLAVVEDGTGDVRKCEREWFGMDHCEAGQWLVEEWGLPGVFGMTAGGHHQTAQSDKFDMVALVGMACQIADALGFTAVKPLAARTIEEVLTELPAKDMARVLPYADQLGFEIALKVNSLEM